MKHMMSALVALVGLVACGDGGTPSIKAAVSVPTTGTVQMGAATIEYFSVGKGPAIVLLSGRGLDVKYLEPLAVKLSESGYQAIRINRRGAGRSTGPLEHVNYHTHAGDVAGTLRMLGIAEAHVLGHALGGRIAQAFADAHPDMTASVILAPAAGRVAGDPRESKVIGRMFSPNATEAEIAVGMELMVGDPGNSERVWKWINASKVTNAVTLKAEATISEPLRAWWARPGASPYLVLQGLRDRFAPPENARIIKRDLGDRVTVVELPEVGHVSVIESVDEVAATIVPFLNKLNSSNWIAAAPAGGERRRPRVDSGP